MSRVVIVGSGGVGSATAYALTYIDRVREVVLVDRNKESAYGEAMDIYHGFAGISTTTVREGEYDDCWDADVIVITAGRNRKPGESRNDLIEENQKIMQSIMDNIYPFYNNAFVIIVSNPVDKLTEYVVKQGFIHREKICGTGCMIDTSRWIAQLSKYLNVSNSRIKGFAIGEHGENQQMLWDMVTVDNIPIDEYCRQYEIEWNEEIRGAMHDTVKNMGAEIIKRKGRTQYGIATTVAYLIKCLLGNEKVMVSVGVPDINNDGIVVSRLVYIGSGKILEVL